MTKREAFKVGFLAKLASVGLTPSDLVEMLEKRAEGWKDMITGPTDVVKGLGDILNTLVFGIGVPATALTFVGAPYLAGKATGALHSELTDVTPDDIERMKLEDFTGTYKSEADKIRRKLERDKWRAQLMPHA